MYIIFMQKSLDFFIYLCSLSWKAHIHRVSSVAWVYSLFHKSTWLLHLKSNSTAYIILSQFNVQVESMQYKYFHCMYLIKFQNDERPMCVSFFMIK